MKALSLWQPWASLIALGVKTIETRSWSTDYRGPLAIHAAKSTEGIEMIQDLSDDERVKFTLPLTDVGMKAWSDLPFGSVLTTCDLLDVLPITRQRGPNRVFDEGAGLWRGMGGVLGGAMNIEDQRPYGDYTPGRFAWLLANVSPLGMPTPAKGHQGLWNWEPK